MTSAIVGVARALIVGLVFFHPYGAVGLLILIGLGAFIGVPIIALPSDPRAKNILRKRSDISAQPYNWCVRPTARGLRAPRHR